MAENLPDLPSGGDDKENADPNTKEPQKDKDKKDKSKKEKDAKTKDSESRGKRKQDSQDEEESDEKKEDENVEEKGELELMVYCEKGVAGPFIMKVNDEHQFSLGATEVFDDLVRK